MSGCMRSCPPLSAGVPLRERRWSMLRLSHQADSEVKPKRLARRHERSAVVGQDTVELEEPLEELEGLLELRRATDVHCKNEAAVLVADGQRLAALQIAGSPPALVSAQ